MWPNPQETVDLVTLTEEIPNWKLRFFCSVGYLHYELKHDTNVRLKLLTIFGILCPRSIMPNKIPGNIIADILLYCLVS